MALWIRNRPPERCHEAEVEVAEMLAHLPDDWVIRWGFHYRDARNVAREGDFLVLGPKGGLLVIEVKSGGLTLNPHTGQWSTPDGDDPGGFPALARTGHRRPGAVLHGSQPRPPTPGRRADGGKTTCSRRFKGQREHR